MATATYESVDTMKKKLLHIITTIERGGAENAILTLAREQVNFGLEVAILPLKGRLSLLEEYRSAGIVVFQNFVNRPFLFQLIGISFMRTKYDLFHAHLPRSEILARVALRSKFYVTRHNTETFFPRAPILISRLLSKWVLSRAARVIAISKAVKIFLETSGELPRNKDVQVIYYGYSPHAFSKVSKKAYFQDRTFFRLGTVGRLTTQKNLGMLLQIAHALKSQGINFQLEIAGEGDLYGELIRKVSELNIANKVSFLGKITDVYGFLSALDIFYLTSNYEGFGLVLLEAMDSGVPIIACRNSAIPEVLGKDHPGLVETNDVETAVNISIQLLTDRLVNQRFLHAQNERLKTFGLKQYLNDHITIYGLTR